MGVKTDLSIYLIYLFIYLSIYLCRSIDLFSHHTSDSGHSIGSWTLIGSWTQHCVVDTAVRFHCLRRSLRNSQIMFSVGAQKQGAAMTGHYVFTVALTIKRAVSVPEVCSHPTKRPLANRCTASVA